MNSRIAGDGERHDGEVEAHERLPARRPSAAPRSSAWPTNRSTSAWVISVVSVCAVEADEDADERPRRWRRRRRDAPACGRADTIRGRRRMRGRRHRAGEQRQPGDPEDRQRRTAARRGRTRWSTATAKIASVPATAATAPAAVPQPKPARPMGRPVEDEQREGKRGAADRRQKHAAPRLCRLQCQRGSAASSLSRLSSG